MPKGKKLRQKSSGAKSPRKGPRLQRKTTVAIALLLGLSLAGGILARWRSMTPAVRSGSAMPAAAPLSPALQQQSVPPPNSPSKEYIYAGDKLIATEEPSTSSTLPSAPTNLQAIVWCQVHLTWDDNSSNETGFKIERSTDGGNTFSLYTTVEANTTECHFLPRPSWKESAYIYRVRATGAIGDSAPSNTITAPALCNTCSCAEGFPSSQNGSLALTGSSAYVNVLNSPSLNITGPITVEAWVKTNINGTFFNRILSRYSNVDGGYALDLYQNKVRFWVLQNSSSADYITSNTALSPNAWYHVAGVADGSQLRVYINGTLDGSKSSNWLPYSGATSLQIGPQYFQGVLYFPFNGLIDEVRITSATLYNGTFTPQTHLLKGVTTRALWKFDDQTANDASGNGNNGTFTEGATISEDVPPPRQLVAWTSATANVTVAGNSLTKNAGSPAWDGGALSTRVLMGDGYLEVAASETTTDRLVGLSTNGAAPNYWGIDFGIRQYYGTLYIIESNGTNRGSFGSYIAGDKLRVAIEGGVVRYYRNCTLLYTSTLTQTYPLKVDACLYDPAATINNAVIAGNLR